ncbi:hypothetical protein GOP47_0028372 [Adiantum capillus-veneris]|nr:hypothetical protein GOP47_0028372 [Adiantum capillus-veneris]
MAPDMQALPAVPFGDPQVLKEVKENAINLRENPLLTKAQHDLKEQLLDQKRELEDRIREKRFVLKNATKKREVAGVKMFGLQKTLGTLQTSLKSANDRLSTIHMEHLKADEELCQYQKEHKAKSAGLVALQEKMEKAKHHLNSLGEAVKHIESHNEKVKSDIAVTRRVTYATEEDIVKAEKDKKDQDYFIAHLQHEIKRHLDKKELILAKLAAQKRETQVARDALSEAEIEMEIIHSEKKQIMAQWRSSLVVLARCDEAVQGLINAIQKQKEQELAIQGEKHSLRKAVKKEHAKVEQEVATLNSIENRIKVIQRKMQQVVAKRLKFLEEYARILVSVQETEAKEDKIIKETAVITAEIQVIEKQILKESEETMMLEDDMIRSLGNQVTLERSHQKLVHDIMAVRQNVKKEDMMVTELEFELAQIRNDVLKVAIYNQSVRDALEALESEIKQKLLIVSKLDLEIKRKRSDVDVKTKEIDRLNKHYDKLTANFVDKNFTPWDHMIANISYEISALAKASTQSQRQWLTMQSELVDLTSENNCLSEKLQKLESEKAALLQRNERLQTDLGLLTKSMKDLDDSMRHNHCLIVRFNDLIAKNTTLQQFLENENFNTQTSIVLSLKDLENDLVQLEVCLKDTAKERDEVNEEVAELQHHVKLWTTKIAFEKQTQDTVMKAIMGPMAMTAALQKELDRLKLKLENLGCLRDRMISSLETRVSNRRQIFVKVQAVSQKKASDGQDAEEALHIKLVADLRKQIRDVSRHDNALTERVEDLQGHRESLSVQVENYSQSITRMTNQQEQLRVRLREVSFRKTSHLLATALQQRMVKRHCDFKANKWKVKIKVTLEDDFSEALRQCVTLYELVQALMRDAPQLQPKLDMISVQLDLAIKY